MQHNFRCSDDLCKLGKEYLNSLTCKFYSFFSGQNSDTFDILHTFLPLTVAKLSTLKNSLVYFGPPCSKVCTSGWSGQKTGLVADESTMYRGLFCNVLCKYLSICSFHLHLWTWCYDARPWKWWSFTESLVQTTSLSMFCYISVWWALSFIFALVFSVVSRSFARSSDCSRTCQWTSASDDVSILSV